MALTPSVLPTRINYTRNPVVVVLQSSTTPITPRSVKVQLQINIDAYMEQELYVEEYPDALGVVRFDLSTLFNDILQHDLQSPDFSERVLQIAYPDMLRVSITATEYQNTTVISSLWLNDVNLDGDFFLMIQGGLSSEALKRGYTLDNWLDNATYNPFLTWQSLVRSTPLEAKNVFYFFNLTEEPSVGVRVSMYKKDILISTVNVVVGAAAATSITANSNSIYKLYAGALKLNLSSFITAPDYAAMTHYQVWVVKNGSLQISPKITISIDRTYYPHPIYLTFQNSAGGYDDILLKGEFENVTAYERSTVKKKDFSQPILEEITKVVEIVSKKVNTGFLSLTNINLMRELLLSQKVFEIVDDLLIPIKITDKTKELFKSKNFTNSIQVQYEYIYPESSFTDLKMLPVL